MPYRLRTFGGWKLLDADGEPLDVVRPQTKGGAVLAYLATRPVGESANREELLSLLWPERTEEEGRNTLRVTLSRLRDRLPDGALGGKGQDRIWLDDSVLTSDVRAFQRALDEGRPGQALDLYQGLFLEHVHLSEVPSFNRWAEEQRGTYRRQAYRAALSHAEECREAGDFSEAESAYRKALDLAPLKEEPAAGLIQTLAAKGERSDALQLLESFRERLDKELDLSPSDRLRELGKRVRAARGRDPGPDGDIEVGVDGSTGPSEVDERGHDDRAADSRRYAGATGSVVGALLIALLGTGLWLLRAADGSEDGRAVRTAGPTVAVLPFSNLGTTGEGEPLLHGLHADILTRLSNASGLSVVSRTSVEPYRNTNLSLSAIADSLNATWIVEGGVQRAEGQLQVNAQLIDPETDTHAWAQSYRRELTAENLFAIQTDLAKRIVRSLEAELTPSEEERVARRPTDDLQAYRLYVQGRSRQDTRTEEGMRESVEYFQQAIQQDSSFALAWAGLADAVGLFEAKEYASPKESLPDHERTARRALELGPDLAEAHAAMGHVHMHQQNAPEALRALQRAVELKPSYALAHHWLGFLLFDLGRPQAAYEHLSLAVELNPSNQAAQASLLAVLIGREELEAAETQLRQLDSLPDERRWQHQANFLYHARRWDELETLLRKQRADNYRWHFGLARIAILRGDTATAREHLAQLREAERHLGEGLVHAALGEEEQAFRALGRVDHWDGRVVRRILQYFYPDVLDPLRDDPRYRELLREANQSLGLNPDGSLPDSVNVSFDAQADE